MAALSDIFLVQQTDSRVTEELIHKAVSLGYKTVAVSTVFHLTKQGKKKKHCPEAINWNKKPSVEKLKKQHRNLKVLSRLTVPLEDGCQLHQIGASDAVNRYDILAVRPTTEKLFQQACKGLDVDLISLDFTTRLPFYIKMPQVRMAIERGINFEITYSPAIRDSTQQRNIISSSLELTRASRGRGIVISSEAESVMDLRGPYDIINLGRLFGLKEEQAKAAVSRNVRSLLFHAEARRGSGKAAVAGIPVVSLAKREMWKLGRQSNSDDDDEDDIMDDNDISNEHGKMKETKSDSQNEANGEPCKKRAKISL